MKSIPLTKGLEAIVDDEDYDMLSQFKWRTSKAGAKFYALAYLGGGKSSPFYDRMHTLLLCPPKGVRVDHEDGNGLNNQRSNLRLCTHAQNLWNSGLWNKPSRKSKFKGVSFAAKKGLTRPWVARINMNGSELRLGAFATQEEAASCYDSYAVENRGAFAVTNLSLGLL